MTALPAQLPRLLVDRAVAAALEEDLGLAGDLTSQATLAPDAVTTAVLSALGHVALTIVFVLSTLYATDVLPEPREHGSRGHHVAGFETAAAHPVNVAHEARHPECELHLPRRVE